jgi:hypothetical protein
VITLHHRAVRQFLVARIDVTTKTVMQMLEFVMIAALRASITAIDEAIRMNRLNIAITQVAAVLDSDRDVKRLDVRDC